MRTMSLFVSVWEGEDTRKVGDISRWDVPVSKGKNSKMHIASKFFHFSSIEWELTAYSYYSSKNEMGITM